MPVESFIFDILLRMKSNIAKPLDKAARSMEVLGLRLRKLEKAVFRFNTIAFAARQALVGAVGLTGGIVVSTKFAADLEEQMLEVAKSADLTVKATNLLTDAIIEMSRRIPLSTTELSDIAVQAGRFGIAAGLSGVQASEALSKFTEVVGKAAIATSFSAEEAATSLAKFTAIFPKIKGKADRFLSAMNELENQTVATVGEIDRVARRLGPFAVQVGVSAQEVLGLSAAMKEMGLTSQVAGTNLGLILARMTRNVSGFARVAGTSTNEFADLIRTAPVEALLKFAEGLQRLRDKDIILFTKALQEVGLGSARVQVVMSALTGGLKRVRRAIGIANDAFEKGTSLQREFERQMSGLNAQFRILLNNITAFVKRVGATMLPIFKAAIFVANIFVNILNLIPSPLLFIGAALVLAVGALGIFIAGLVLLISMAGVVLAGFTAFASSLFSIRIAFRRGTIAVAEMAASLFGLTSAQVAATASSISLKSSIIGIPSIMGRAKREIGRFAGTVAFSDFTVAGAVKSMGKGLDLFASRVLDVGDVASDSIKSLGESIAFTGKSILGSLGQMTGGFRGLAGTIARSVQIAVVHSVAFSAAFVVAFGPVLLVIGAVSAVILALKDNFLGLGDAFSGLKDAVVGVITAFAEGLGLTTKQGQSFGSLMSDILKTVFSPLIVALKIIVEILAFAFRLLAPFARILGTALAIPLKLLGGIAAGFLLLIEVIGQLSPVVAFFEGLNGILTFTALLLQDIAKLLIDIFTFNIPALIARVAKPAFGFRSFELLTGGETPGAQEGAIVSPRPGGTRIRVAEGGESEVIAPLSALPAIAATVVAPGALRIEIPLLIDGRQLAMIVTNISEEEQRLARLGGRSIRRRGTGG